MNFKLFILLTLSLINNIQSTHLLSNISLTKLKDEKYLEKNQNYYINSLKLHHAKLFGDNFIKFVFEHNKDENDAKIIQRYFRALSVDLTNKKITSCFDVLQNYLLKKDNNLQKNIDQALLPAQMSNELISEIEKEMFGEDVYFVIYGAKWNMPQIVPWGFDPNDPDQSRHRHSCCPSRNDITIVHEAIKRVVEKIKTI